uniref:Uncharacterized protein n=1 Tax=Setaria viridis TaxID=4556 RepID=A0A4U6UKS3_SETVI|nr:hypothetical protein SEVIR_5G171501v2 [Setaria viridis]
MSFFEIRLFACNVVLPNPYSCIAKKSSAFLM